MQKLKAAEVGRMYLDESVSEKDPSPYKSLINEEANKAEQMSL
jgi:hypothetical protein